MDRHLSWNAYIDTVEALCRRLTRPDFEPEAHVDDLRRLSETLDLSDPTLVARFRALSRDQRAPYVTDQVVETPTCGIMLVSFRADGEVGLHDHPDQSGFILCCRGHMKVEAYDAVGEAPLRLRLAVRTEAGPGDYVSLTPTRGNIHGLECTEPTWLIDVFTPPLSEAGRARVRGYVLGPEIAPDECLATMRP